MSGHRGKAKSRNNPDNHQKKKKHEKVEDADPPAENELSTIELFRSYQIELDNKYDKYERLVKKSRDLTNESKRIIFLLHRINRSNRDEVLTEARMRLSTLFVTIINDIGLELSKREVYQYIRAFTGGLQEFVEALTFYHYLKSGEVMLLQDIYSDSLKAPTETSDDMIVKTSELPLSAYLTPVEYILGIADLTGELMRKCINSMGTGDTEEPFRLCALLQNMYQGLLQNSKYSKELKRKLFTLKSSMHKVENVCYTIKIRGTEIPRHRFKELFSTEDNFEEAERSDL